MKVYGKLVHLPIKVMIAILIAYVDVYTFIVMGLSFKVPMLMLMWILWNIAYKCTKYEKILCTLPVKNEKRYYYKILSMAIVLCSYGISYIVFSGRFGGVAGLSGAWGSFWLMVTFLVGIEFVLCMIRKNSDANVEMIRLVVLVCMVEILSMPKAFISAIALGGTTGFIIGCFIVGTVLLLISVLIGVAIKMYLKKFDINRVDNENTRSLKKEKKSNWFVSGYDTVVSFFRLILIKIKKAKWIILGVLAVCIIVVMVPELNSRILSEKDKEMYKILVEGKWGGDNGGDSATIYFSQDKKFSYYCSCGSPVDDFDLYYTYVFKKNGEIEVYGFFIKDTLKIKSISQEKMELEVNGEIREFYHRENRP